MGLVLKAVNLISRTIRINASQGKKGRSLLTQVTGGGITPKRKISSLTRLRGSGDSSLIDFVWNAAKAFTGFIGGLVKGISFSARTLVSWFVQTSTSLSNFDWNASDKELEEAIKQRNTQLAAIWGGVLGKGVGWLAGIAVGAGIAMIVPVIGGAMLARLVVVNTTKEFLEEIRFDFVAAIQQTARILIQDAVILTYMNLRRLIKSLPEHLLARIVGSDLAKKIKNQWGSESAPRMTLSGAIEERIEKIDNQALRAFTEEFLEEAWEGFIESGYVVANQIDQAYAQAKLANKDAFGEERTIEITPDREAEEEKITLVNLPQTLAVPAIQQAVTTHRLLYNRDVGLLMGLPIDEYVKAKPQTLRIVIDMFSRKEPPFYHTHQDRFVWATITIPDVNKAAIDWNRIKVACGGANGYNWGRFRATAVLDNGRKLTLYAGTEAEAEDRLKAFLQLTEAKLLSLSTTEEKKEGERLKKPKLQKELTRVYPGYFTIINREELLDPTQGKATLRGKNYRDNKVKIPLWTSQEPKNASRLIAQVLRRGF